MSEYYTFKNDVLFFIESNKVVVVSRFTTRRLQKETMAWVNVYKRRGASDDEIRAIIQELEG